MEQRLIDANALGFLCFSNIENYSIFSQYSEDYKRGFNDAVTLDIKIINNAPTIEERQKGKWELDSIGAYCSECKIHPDYTSNFCPDCGADMRGKEE